MQNKALEVGLLSTDKWRAFLGKKNCHGLEGRRASILLI